MKEICAGYNESGQRLDKLLRKVLPNANDSFIYKMLRKKNITLNDRKASGSETVLEGDVVRIWFSDETYAKFSGERNQGSEDSGPGEDAGAGTETDTRLRSAGNINSERAALQRLFDSSVIYEDRDILVINKPAGLLSQKAEQWDISVVELLINNLLSRSEITKEQLKTFHPSICNRLDRNTSGVLVCGKSLRGLQDMSEMIRGRSVKKDYLAVVSGEVREGQHIKAYLLKDHASNKVRIVDAQSDIACLAGTGGVNGAKRGDINRRGRPQSESLEKPQNDGPHTGTRETEFIDTEFRPLYTDGEYSLIMVRIHTGKTHQIRAQMAALGHPLCGDVKYGGERFEKRRSQQGDVYPRQLLHAYSLAIPDGRRFIAPVPDDIKAAVGGYEWGHGRPGDFEDLPLRI